MWQKSFGEHQNHKYGALPQCRAQLVTHKQQPQQERVMAKGSNTKTKKGLTVVTVNP